MHSRDLLLAVRAEGIIGAVLAPDDGEAYALGNYVNRAKALVSR